MGLEMFDNYECEGQMELQDYYPAEPEIPEGIFAVGKIFARARKQMNLAEFKAFTYALTHIRFKEKKNSNKIHMNKKTLALIVGVNSDSDHLSQDLKRSIGNLPQNSFIVIEDEDKDFFESGVLVTSIRMYRNNAVITLNPDYMPLFERLEKDYITMWSGDIYSMRSERSIDFYEVLRLHTDTRLALNQATVGVKYMKELFNIPKEGKGSYMRAQGGFNRTEFERKVIDPICEDLARCRMINLTVQNGGKYYQKVKKNGRVIGYQFNWTYSSHPAVATAKEVAEINQDPQLLKIAKNALDGRQKPPKKANKNDIRAIHNHEQYTYDADFEAALLSAARKEKRRDE